MLKEKLHQVKYFLNFFIRIIELNKCQVDFNQKKTFKADHLEKN
jgi:ABC-type phosphate/phosphonate transport system ATPase subunit